MKKYSIIFFIPIITLWLLMGCKKDKPELIDIVEGLDNVEIEQVGYAKIPITLKNGLDNGDVHFFVANLPKNMTATISQFDAVSQHAELLLKADSIGVGVINARFVVSQKNKVQQQSFKIEVKAHPALALAGEYSQNCDCPDLKVANNPVTVSVRYYGNNYFEMTFRNMIVKNTPTLLYGQYRFGQYPIYLTGEENGTLVAAWGTHDDHSMKLMLVPSDSCYTILSRK